MLVDLGEVEREYFNNHAELDDPSQRVCFGASGHSGSPLRGSFTDSHVAAITQAICDYRESRGIDGPLYVGKDTHAISGPAQDTALEVLAANGVETIVQRDGGFTPTPVISRAILVYNRHRTDHLADGIVLTSSHNPPEDGGLKYNSCDGGPPGTEISEWVQIRANELLRDKNVGVRRRPSAAALLADTTHEEDLILPYVQDLRCVIDMDAIRAAKLRVAVDPLGGASLSCWAAINAVYCVNIEVANAVIDPSFSFMTVDHDGAIRMDCSSVYAMARLMNAKDKYQLAFGNDPDAARYGIVTPSLGLMRPNQCLAVATDYLLDSRQGWKERMAVGKTMVASGLIDKIAQKFGRKVHEVPVGFKWFAPELLGGTCCFGGDESAGATFLRRDGTPWTTDKDGLIMNLLAAEVTAWTGKDPAEYYTELTSKFGTPHYMRIDSPATPEEKIQLQNISLSTIRELELAGEPIVVKLTRALGNNARIGGLKIIAKSGWFAVRPSDTDNLYRIYAESFKDQAHLNAIVMEAGEIVKNALAA
jgi:phosphoglucomutase